MIDIPTRTAEAFARILATTARQIVADVTLHRRQWADFRYAEGAGELQKRLAEQRMEKSA